MVVELNTNAFEKSKNGDLFVIEEKNGKKYACPIKKEHFLKDVHTQLEDARKEILEFKNIVLEQKTMIESFKKEINDKLLLITKIIGGYNNEDN